MLFILFVDFVLIQQQAINKALAELAIPCTIPAVSWFLGVKEPGGEDEAFMVIPFQANSHSVEQYIKDKKEGEEKYVIASW